MKRFLVTGSVVSALGIGLTIVLLWFLGGAGAWPASLHAAGNVITVCPGGGCDYDGIQAAVDAAAPGDEIRVATGTYAGVQSRSGVTQAVYLSKTLTIRGGYSPDFAAWAPDTYPTTLDAEGMGRGLYLVDDVSPTLEALSVTNGSAVAGGGGSTGGGGIYINGAHPTISGCQVYSNAGLSGAGVYFYGSSNVTLIGNRIFDNRVTGGTGGGVYAYASDNAVLTGNRVYGNRANNGGGLYIGNSDGIALSGNEIYTNTATSQYGGGMLISASDDVDLSHNRVYSNTANGSGGGLHLNTSTGTMVGNRFYGNVANGNGGGVNLDQSDVLADGDIVRWNRTVMGEGSGIYMYECAPVLSNTVVADNVDEGAGLGNRVAIWVDSASPRFMHLTMARHPSHGMYIVSNGTLTSSVTLTNSIIYSHSFGLVVYGTLGKTSKALLYNTLSYSNTVSFDNLGNSIGFDYGTVYGDPDFLADGYHIGPASAAIDSGLDAGVLSDVDGGARPAAGGYDIGADERPHEIHVPLVVHQWP